MHEKAEQVAVSQNVCSPIRRLPWRCPAQVVDLSPAARSRVLKDLRLLKRDGPAVGIEVDDAECLTDWVVRRPGTSKWGRLESLDDSWRQDAIETRSCPELSVTLSTAPSRR